MKTYFFGFLLDNSFKGKEINIYIFIFRKKPNHLTCSYKSIDVGLRLQG